jgi:hypothetical protein
MIATTYCPVRAAGERNIGSLPSGLYRRPRNHTGSADPTEMGARGLMCLRTITAGGEFRPALRTLKPRDKPSKLLVQVGSAYWLRHITHWLSPIMKEIALQIVQHCN